MDINDCFHEICHLWVMVKYLGYKTGRAFVAYDNGIEGMLTIEGYTLTYNGYDDLDNGLSFIVAGIAGDAINNQFESDTDLFELFSSDIGYSQDYSYFKKLYNTAVGLHSLKKNEKEWFDDKIHTIKDYLNTQNLDQIREAANELFENKQYFLHKT